MKRLSPDLLFEKQNTIFRNPVELFGFSHTETGVTSKSLHFTVSPQFIELLEKLRITLFLTREYEHLVVALYAHNNRIYQSFFQLPHPSGLAVNRKTNTVYIASTRNPNQLYEFKPADAIEKAYLMPARVKFYSGHHYIHDLAFIQDRLHANSVGQNSIIEINMDRSSTDRPVWWPRIISDRSKNYIQLNSIAAGDSLEGSFFTASSAVISSRRPGQKNFPVDKKGVIFSGKTREVIAGGLTRPHSARIYNNTLYVLNSGYGEIGYIDNTTYKPLLSLGGWTRGLCIIDDIAFIGISRVLPRFRMYAPGITKEKKRPGIVAVSLRTGNVIGSLSWPGANQIFAIDHIPCSITPGFMYNAVQKTTRQQQEIFYQYKLR